MRALFRLILAVCACVCIKRGSPLPLSAGLLYSWQQWKNKQPFKAKGIKVWRERMLHSAYPQCTEPLKEPLDNEWDLKSFPSLASLTTLYSRGIKLCCVWCVCVCLVFFLALPTALKKKKKTFFTMATVTSSSRRSSSSYRSSARYSTSSTYRSEGSLGGSCDSLDPLFEPFLDSADRPSLFGDEESSSLASFSSHSRPSYGHTGETDHVPLIFHL